LEEKGNRHNASNPLERYGVAMKKKEVSLDILEILNQMGIDPEKYKEWTNN
jgi:hypothetical protein